MNNQWLKLTSVIIFVVLGNIVQTTKVQSSSNLLSNNLVQENNDLLIAQSRRTYTCRYGRNGASLQPNIPGLSINGWQCFVPVEAGKCVAIKDPNNPYLEILHGSSPDGFYPCDPSIQTSQATGKEYYQFSAVGKDVTFILE